MRQIAIFGPNSIRDQKGAMANIKKLPRLPLL